MVTYKVVTRSRPFCGGFAGYVRGGEAHAPHEPRRYSPPYLWWRRRATQGIRALAGAVDQQVRGVLR
ncbi:hypothetical protein MCB86_16780 [Pseudomonas sp. KSR10]|uniref:hypothetical protein n=1 Tax=Pseudomonas sp. KSR10 TaxID=2916654 RepID=UPI001EF874C1|nr:hypothetical protein [Pseudomonas sp. KSR10]MCG6541730.1 hypothetical protein [Pseudomonas sp. KSR10]